MSASKELVRDIAICINGVEISSDDRTRIIGALFDIVHEHHQSIILLLDNKLCASAGSLLRSIFETYVRAVWFMKCASDSDVENFLKDKFKKGSFQDRLNDIEQLEDITPHFLSLIKQKIWGALNSYAHGGFIPVGRRFDGGEIISNHAEEEVELIERLSNVLSVLSVYKIAELCGDDNLMIEAEKLANRVDGFY